MKNNSELVQKLGVSVTAKGQFCGDFVTCTLRTETVLN